MDVEEEENSEGHASSFKQAECISLITSDTFVLEFSDACSRKIRI